MSKHSIALATLPPEVGKALRQLGENLALARKRRRETQRAWAQRLGVSLPTLIRLEKGDPGVAMGTYATALWLMGRTAALPDVADPALDRGALELNIREAKRRSVRSQASIDKRLASPAAPLPSAPMQSARSPSPPPSAPVQSAHSPSPLPSRSTKAARPRKS